MLTIAIYMEKVRLYAELSLLLMQTYLSIYVQIDRDDLLILRKLHKSSPLKVKNEKTKYITFVYNCYQNMCILCK